MRILATRATGFAGGRLIPASLKKAVTRAFRRAILTIRKSAKRSISGAPKNPEADKIMPPRAEMKVPGEAWLPSEIIPKGGQSPVVQTALYAPKDLFGMLYRYAMHPARLFLFASTARNAAKDAEVLERHRLTAETSKTV